MDLPAVLFAASLTGHPLAGAFPGEVPPETPRVVRTVQVDLARPGWHSTGLYAPPGGVIEVRPDPRRGVPGLGLRIGAHTDDLWHLPQWKRWPEIAAAVPVWSPATRYANPFGGPVYLDVPDRPAGGVVSVAVRGAIAAPWFVRGRTSLREWRRTLRNLPAPWAELEGRRIILTVPSSAVSALDDPETLLAFWDRAVEAQDALAGWGPAETRRPERLVCDVQIAAGYLHSGYPIMAHLDLAPAACDLDLLLSSQHEYGWGPWHELGHNRQSDDWTFEGTREVTCNLFTLYVLKTLCGMPPSEARPDKLGGGRAALMRTYFAKPPSFARWGEDPFLALISYVQLVEEFGWEPFVRVFREYRALPDGERPRTDAAKRDQWLVRMSRATGRDLGPFYSAWGVPVSADARKQVAELPDWLPEGFPPNATPMPPKAAMSKTLRP